MALTKIGTDGVKDDAVTSGKIPANAVGSSELADQSVTLAKLPHGDSNNNGKFLRANNGADPSFETVDTTPSFGSQNISTTGTLSSGDITISTNTDASLFINTTNANGSHLRLQTSGTTKSFIGQASGISGSLGNANDLALRSAEDIVFSTNNNNTPNVKIDSSGRLGVATSSPHSYAIATFNDSNGISLTGSTQTRIVMQHANGGTNLKNFDIQTSDGNLRFRTIGDNNTSATERLRIQSGGGISFNGDTAAANALDDYEEGTWTPSFNASISLSSNVSSRYVKTGRSVTAQFYVNISGTYGNSAGASGTALVISGLPYASASNSYHVGSIDVGSGGAAGAYLRVSGGGSDMVVLVGSGSVSTPRTHLKGNTIGAGDYVIGSVTYQTAQTELRLKTKPKPVLIGD